jgi:threonyl-tRNA synthetase
MPTFKVVIDLETHFSPHPIWNMNEAEKIEIVESQAITTQDKIAFSFNQIFQKSLNIFTVYKKGDQMNEEKYLKRLVLLETFSGVPGMIGGMMRHLLALRTLNEDGGWIHHLLEEAGNERTHLFTLLKIRQPGVSQRIFILFSQLLFISYYTTLYLISPKTAHKFVSYMAEDAFKIYSEVIKDLDEGKLPVWSLRNASKEDMRYWNLSEDAKFRDVLVAIRADKLYHREFNDHFSKIYRHMPINGHKLVIIGDNSKNDDVINLNKIGDKSNNDDVKINNNLNAIKFNV